MCWGQILINRKVVYFLNSQKIINTITSISVIFYLVFMLSYISLLELFILLSYLVRMAWAEWSSNSSRLLLYSWLSNTYYLADTHFFPFLFFFPLHSLSQCSILVICHWNSQACMGDPQSTILSFWAPSHLFQKGNAIFLLIMEINILKKGINFSFSSLFFFFFSILSISLSRTLFIFFKKKFSI